MIQPSAQPLAAAFRDSPFSDTQSRFAAGRLGMLVFLVSLSVLFIASLIGFAVIRVQLPDWPSDLPRVPLVLILSTLVLAVSSATLQSALQCIRANLQQRAAWLMSTTVALGLLFLVVQVLAWATWFSLVGDQWEDSQPYRWALASFYVLTGVHALHVLGGLAPMVIVAARALRRRYSAANHAGVHYCAMYWHFLGGVWLVLYATLLIGS